MKFVKIVCISIFLLMFMVVGGFADEQGQQSNIAQVEQDALSMAELVGKVIIYLILLIVIGYAILQLSKKGRLFNKISKEGGKLQILETRMLGHKQFLMVVDYDGEKVLLGVGPGMISNLCRLGVQDRGGVSEKKDEQRPVALS